MHQRGDTGGNPTGHVDHAAGLTPERQEAEVVEHCPFPAPTLPGCPAHELSLLPRLQGLVAAAGVGGNCSTRLRLKWVKGMRWAKGMRGEAQDMRSGGQESNVWSMKKGLGRL